MSKIFSLDSSVLVQYRFFMRNVAVDASASCCLYIIMWGAEKFG